jgi:transcriptional regulator with XRE-family HTH domain
MRLRDRATFASFLSLLGESERAFATRARLSHSTVNHLLCGRRETCSVATADAIERALGCPPGLLFAPDERRTGRRRAGLPERVTR